LGKFWRENVEIFKWPFWIFYRHLVYFMTIWYILWPFGMFYDHLVCFMTIWYILWPFGIFCVHLVYFSGFGIMYQEKSGNPDNERNARVEENLKNYICMQRTRYMVWI
jgi:hypothetical protein